jgi:hypothetical protein
MYKNTPTHAAIWIRENERELEGPGYLHAGSLASTDRKCRYSCHFDGGKICQRKIMNVGRWRCRYSMQDDNLAANQLLEYSLLVS